MSFHRFIRAMLTNGTFRIFGTGEQTRDFTYVGDAARVTIDALKEGPTGLVYNIGGGNRVSLKEVIDHMARITGADPNMEFQGFEKGDMMHTMADASLAREHLKYSPETTIEEGLEAEVRWMRDRVEKGK